MRKVTKDLLNIPLSLDSEKTNQRRNEVIEKKSIQKAIQLMIVDINKMI